MRRIVHIAKFISDRGDVSPLCAAPPRKLKLKTETWTNHENAVTCQKCLDILAGKKPHA
jgi:hypothetical protein